MTDNKHAEKETTAYENIKNMLLLKQNGELNTLLASVREKKRVLETAIKLARSLEEQLYGPEEDEELPVEEEIDQDEEELSESVAEDSVDEPAAEEDSAPPVTEVAPEQTDKKAEPEKKPHEHADKTGKHDKADKPVHADKKDKQEATKPEEKKTPVLRRINLAEIERRYGTGNRQRLDRSTAPGGQSQPRTPGTGTTRPYPPRPLSGNRPFIKAVAPDIAVSKSEPRKVDNKKKDGAKSPEGAKKTMNKRTLIRKGFIDIGYDDERMGSRKLVNKKSRDIQSFVAPQVEKAVITTENLTVKILSEKIGKPAPEIIKQLMLLGIMTNINSVVDFATMELVASELGVEIELKLDKTKEEQLADFHIMDSSDSEDLERRPPIVTVMGHVDHGKTSLLDAIRTTDVASGEAGGITQHIGAYTISVKGERITFIDTPGHEAFTSMRARGAKVTDVVVLVVAADDGIMPQTIEAINHAKAANVPIIVAINKIDRPAANIERIKQQLTEYNILPEEWGGDAIMVPVSAKTGENLDKLLESILLVADVAELRANPKRKAMGTIIEAKLDKAKGPVATVIVQNGTLNVGDTVISGTAYGKIRAMQDDAGNNRKDAGPAFAVAILGLSEVPNAGDSIYVVEDEKMAKQVIGERVAKQKEERLETQKVTLDDMFSRISEGALKSLNIIVKADMQGTVEALKASLNKLVNDEVRIHTIHGGVGAINRSDLMLAEASGAVIIGFNVRPDTPETKQLAERGNIDIRIYRVIYEALDDIEAMMKGMQAPKYQENSVGRAEVRNIFKVSGVGTIAGCYILSGKAVRNCKVHVVREGAVVFEGNLESLKRFKDDAKEVASGYECGISIAGFNDIKELDILEFFVVERIAP